MVHDLLGINYRMCGLSASTLAINNNYMENKSIVERVCGLNGNTAYEDADIWTIMGGLNDEYLHSSLGSLVDTGNTFDMTTVYGALQTIVEHILSLRTNPKLILIVPMHSNRDRVETVPTMAQIRQAIIDVGEYYGVPVLDLWSISGINEYNMQREENPTTRDGVHPTELGTSMYAPKIAKAIQDEFYCELNK